MPGEKVGKVQGCLSTAGLMTRRSWLGACALLRAQEANLFGNAEAYERFMGRWSRKVAPLFVEFAQVPATGRVLDIGSGTGALAEEILRQRPKVRVTGIDPAAPFVEYARKKNPGIDFQTGDAQQLSFPDRTFSAALALLVFNFIPDRLRALRQARRVTLPGGPIAAAVWDYGGEMAMLRTFWRAAVKIDAQAIKLYENNMPLSKAGQLAALWKQAGLEGVSEQPLAITMDFASFADYWEPFKQAQGPAGVFIRGLAPDRLEALRRAVLAELPLRSESEAFRLPARVWAVRGIVPGARAG